MESVKYTPTELAQILKICSKHNVESVKVAGLDVVFSANVKEDRPKPSRKLSPDQEAKSMEASRVEAIRERELRLAQMDIESPYEYEQLLLSNSEKEFVNAAEEHLRSQ